MGEVFWYSCAIKRLKRWPVKTPMILWLLESDRDFLSLFNVRCRYVGRL